MLPVHGARSAVVPGRPRSRTGACKPRAPLTSGALCKLCAGADAQGFVEMDNPHDRVKVAFRTELLEASRPAPALALRWG